jgi:hypothetical protein
LAGFDSCPRWFRYTSKSEKDPATGETVTKYYIAYLNDNTQTTITSKQIYTWSIKSFTNGTYSIGVKRLPYVTPFTELQAPSADKGWSLNAISLNSLRLTASEQENNKTINLDLTQAFASMPILRKNLSTINQLLQYGQNQAIAPIDANIDAIKINCQGLFSHSSLISFDPTKENILYDVTGKLSIDENGMFYGTQWETTPTPTEEKYINMITLLNISVPT